ncbi:MAG TPA: adenylate/guanylate cyclase domain-containing protein [Acetobacteraceae bacterium]|nr:adenylate/guanylate cyclase domain-containing protein [Acetobacteraceae bacterium]
MQCIFCPATVSDAADFCQACGGRLSWRCRECDQRNPTPYLRCRQCGAAREPSPAATEVVRSERKLVTILFADIRGSLELIHGHDPEQVSAILESRVDLMIQAVQTFDGTVSRVMGDGIMAMFGAPRAAEHHALRACLSALRIRETAMQPAGLRDSPTADPVSLRVGLGSGEVVVKPLVAHNFAGYDADGEVVHLAARMEQIAPPNSILLTPQTARLVDRDFKLRTLGQIDIKGLAAQMELYELVARLPRRKDRLAIDDRPATSLVGRDRELAIIANIRQQVMEGQGRVISILGDAGCGKSRLLQEAFKRDRDEWLLLDGQALPYGNKGYRVILDMLAGCFSLEPGDDTATATGKIRSVLASHKEDELLNPLAALHDFGIDDDEWQVLSPAERGRRIQNAVCRLFETISAVRPLALVAEDMHWVDAESQRILTRLVQRSANTRILLIMTHRSEYEPPSPEAAHHVAIRLDPLSETEARLLLSQRIVRGPGVEALEQVLIERTGGNPLFLHEILSGLAEEGVLRRAGRRYRMARAMEPINLPGSVRSLLSERIDRLAANEKDVLQAASVIGPSVTLRLLERVARTPATADVCGRLHAAGFLEPVEGGPEPAYVFHHVLMSEAAYAGLLHQRREVMHARVVDAIEELYGDRIAEHVETLAGHATRARDWRKAVEYARRAGQKTAARDANTESVRFYERALEYLAHWEDGAARRDMAIDLHLAIRDPLFRLGRISAIDDHLRQAEPLLRPMGDTVRLGLLHVLDANALTLRGEYTQALAACAEALRLARALGEPALEARTQFQLGVALWCADDFIACDAPLRAAHAYLEAHPAETRYGLNLGVHVATMSYAARGRAAVGDLAQAEQDLLVVLAIAERHASAFEWVWASIAAGAVNELASRMEEAAAWYDKALFWSRSANTFLLPMIAASRLGLVEARSGKVASGLARLRQAVADLERMGFRNELPFCLAALAEATLASGDVAAAAEVAERARSIAVSMSDHTALVHSLLTMGHCLLRNGRKSAARTRLRSALVLAEEHHLEPFAERCRAALGVRRRDNVPAK